MLHIYKASAGSGKTFTLAYEYIKLLLGIKGTDGKYRLNSSARGENHRSILAVTFTNKATEEMKRRILHELAVLANMEPGWTKPSPYIGKLCAEFSATEEQVRRASELALKNLLMDFSYFSVSTIDAFFQVILRTFAREAELTGNYELELDNDKAIEFGVNELFSWLNNDPDASGVDRVVGWITNYLVQQLHNGNDIKLFNRSSKMHAKFTKLITKISNDTFALHYDEIMDYLRHTPQKLQQFAVALTSRIDDMLGEIKSGCEVALDVIDSHASEPGKVKDNLVNAFKKYVQNPRTAIVKASKTPLSVNEDLTQAYDSARKKYYVKLGPSPDLDAALSSACRCVAEYPPYIMLLEQIRDSLFVLGLIDKVYEFIEKFREENNAILLSDTNSLLREIIGDSDAPFVYERVGLWLRHFLIDEFQDTSRMQWLNIRPLLNESMANDSDSLIIGDEKQCIYRFRDSDPTLLQCQVQQQFPGRTTVTGDTPSANTNWRSAPNVVEFNNALFGALSSAVGVDDIYANVCQQIPDRGSEYPGYVSLMPVLAPSKDKFEEFALKRMTDEMERQLRQGYKYNELCVLVRQRSDGIRVIARLMEIADTAGLPDCEYPLLSEANVISDDAMMLAQAPVIKVIMSVLRAFANPSLSFRDGNEGEATAAKFHSRAEMVEMLNRFDHFSSLGHSPEDALQLALSSEECNWNMQSEMPEMECFNLPSLVEHIIQHRISPRDRKAQNMYIAAFQDLVCDYCATSTPDVGGFVKWWDLSSHRFTVSAPMDAKAIRVMTIHKAKGLEFKCTHIPFLAYKVPKFDGHQWFVSQPLPGIDENIMPPLLPIVPGSFLKNTVFAPQLDRLVYEQLLDELNVLYVAFTRAGQELIANYWADCSGTIGELLASANDSMAQYAGAVPGEFVSGTPDTVPVRKEEQKTALDPHDSMPMRPYEVYDGTTVWNQTQVDFDPDRVEAVTRGTALHNLLALVKDAESVPMAVEKAVRRHIITRAESEPVKVLLMERIGNEKTKHWFSGFKRVLRERQITTDKGEHYRPDRVVWTADGHIDIIDYKFGAERSAAYARQLRNYVRLFAEMGYDNLRAFVWYVDSDHIVPVGF